MLPLCQFGKRMPLILIAPAFFVKALFSGMFDKIFNNMFGSMLGGKIQGGKAGNGRIKNKAQVQDTKPARNEFLHQNHF